MSDTQIFPVPPTAMLKVVHQRMKELFARYDSLGPEEDRAKKALFLEIQEELGVHMEIEEVLFYPAVQNMRADLAIDTVLKSLKAHRQVKDLLEDLLALSSENASLDAKMGELQLHVLAHLEVEEGEIFPHARALPPMTLLKLGADMEDLRDRLQRKR